MKQLNYKLVIATMIVSGLFIGIVRGQEARSRWISKMKSKFEHWRQKNEPEKKEVKLDDFEIASFHQN